MDSDKPKVVPLVRPAGPASPPIFKRPQGPPLTEWEEAMRLEGQEGLEEPAISSTSLTIEAMATRASTVQAARQALSILTSDPALRRDSLGELMARQYAKECLEGMMEIARDTGNDASVRHKAYYDIWTIGYGRPAAIVRAGSEGTLPPTIDADIDRAGEAAAALAKLETYAHLPPEQWPEDLQRATGIHRHMNPTDKDSEA